MQAGPLHSSFSAEVGKILPQQELHCFSVSKYCSRIFLNYCTVAELILHVYLCMCTKIFYLLMNSAEMLVFLDLSLCAKCLLLEDTRLPFRTLLLGQFNKEASSQFFKWNEAFDKVLTMDL